MVQSKKDAAMKKSKIRHTAQLSESFKQTSKQPKDASQFVKSTRTMLDFAIMSLQTWTKLKLVLLTSAS
ncbi:hypothetical protein ACA910_000166 [Epithemia clementina (nom. ined.)]